MSGEGYLIGGLIVGCIAMMILGISASYEEEAQWQKFAKAQNCKVIGHMRGDVSTGFGFSGSGSMVVTTSSTPDKKGFACDDGKQYWR